ncbi:MAG TPA: DUF2306 domain-containing protein [Woeseiaceae bacterium]
MRGIIWIGAILAAVAFFIHAATRYLVFTEASYRIFWPNRYWVLLHFFGGSLALFGGLPQFAARLRRRYPAVHRWTGRVYLAGVAIGVTSAWYMSFHSAIGWASASRRSSSVLPGSRPRPWRWSRCCAVSSPRIASGWCEATS